MIPDSGVRSSDPKAVGSNKTATSISFLMGLSSFCPAALNSRPMEKWGIGPVRPLHSLGGVSGFPLTPPLFLVGLPLRQAQLSRHKRTRRKLLHLFQNQNRGLRCLPYFRERKI